MVTVWHSLTKRISGSGHYIVGTRLISLAGLSLLFQIAAFSQYAASTPAAPAAPTESPYVWLGFFQEHNRLLADAELKGKGSSYHLTREKDKVGIRFGLPTKTHAKVIPVTTAWRQLHAVLAAEQQQNRRDILERKAQGNRQQYLAFLARRDKIILDAVNDLQRALTVQEFQKLRQRVYTEYGGK